jgi:hypothetical protein
MVLSRRPLGVLALLALVCALLAPALVAAPAQAATGRVRGTISGPKGDGPPKVTVTWFTESWGYLGSRKARGGGYSLVLEPGTYRLQFTDLRPAYDVGKYYPADVTVTVTEAATTVKNVKLRVGASIGGVVEAGGKPAAGARVVAANKDRSSFETTANGRGEYALGGLPPGSYSVFTYDKRKRFVGRSSYLPRLKAGKFKKANIRLTERAGRLVVDLYAGDQPYPGIAYVTAVSRKNGQFWTEKAAHGTVTFAGLYRGAYDMVIPGAGGYLGGTVRIAGRVKPGKTSFGTLRLTQRGATITGTVVDEAGPSPPLKDALVVVYDGAGAELARATTGADGTFVVGGELTTRADLSVVVGPGGANPPYLTGVHYCRFVTTTRAGVAVTTGQATALGTIALPHAPNAGDEDPSC